MTGGKLKNRELVTPCVVKGCERSTKFSHLCAHSFASCTGRGLVTLFGGGGVLDLLAHDVSDTGIWKELTCVFCHHPWPPDDASSIQQPLTPFGRCWCYMGC